MWHPYWRERRTATLSRNRTEDGGVHAAVLHAQKSEGRCAALTLYVVGCLERVGAGAARADAVVEDVGKLCRTRLWLDATCKTGTASGSVARRDKSRPDRANRGPYRPAE